MANNDYTYLGFPDFLKEYSILRGELKEKCIIKIKISVERLVGFYSLLS